MKKENEESAPEDLWLPAGTLVKTSDQTRVRGEDYFSYYANSIAVNISQWDIALMFGEVVGEQDGKTVIEEIVKILISREAAKVLNKILTDQITIYEKKFGVIKVPDMSKLAEPEQRANAEEVQD
jgi:hypothetical protein